LEVEIALQKKTHPETMKMSNSRYEKS